MKKTRIGRTIQPFAKAKDVRDIRESLSNPQKTPPLEQSSEIKKLIIQLINLLGSWKVNDKGIKVRFTQTKEVMKPEYEDSLRILATMINLANIVNQDQFIYSNQFDIEEPETYSCTMQGPNSAK